jgi:hypothetical protein
MHVFFARTKHNGEELGNTAMSRNPILARLCLVFVERLWHSRVQCVSFVRLMIRGAYSNISIRARELQLSKVMDRKLFCHESFRQLDARRVSISYFRRQIPIGSFVLFSKSHTRRN